MHHTHRFTWMQWHMDKHRKATGTQSHTCSENVNPRHIVLQLIKLDFNVGGIKMNVLQFSYLFKPSSIPQWVSHNLSLGKELEECRRHLDRAVQRAAWFKKPCLGNEMGFTESPGLIQVILPNMRLLSLHIMLLKWCSKAVQIYSMVFE